MATRLARISHALLLLIVCAVPLITLVHLDERGRWTLNRCAMASPDEHSYLLMAKSLLLHGDISTVAVAGKDTFYPPGLPLVLAAWAKGFGLSIESVHVCIALTACAAMLMAYLVVARLMVLWRAGASGPWLALAVVALTATSYHVLDDALFVFSEPLFMLAAFAWLYAALRIDRWWARPGAATLIALLAVAAALARSAGIVCFAATIFYVLVGLIRRRGDAPDRDRLQAAPALACVVGVILAYYVTLHYLSPEKSIASAGSSHNSYTKQLLGGLGVGEIPPYRLDLFARQLARLTWDHLQDWVQVYVPPLRFDEPHRDAFYLVAARLLMLLSLAGFLTRLWARQGDGKSRMAEIYVLLYVGLYLVWPFYMVRFWIPILPLLLAYVVDTARLAARAGPPRALRPALLWTLLGLLLALNVQELLRKFPNRQQRLNYVSDCLSVTAEIIRTATPDPARTTVVVDDEDYFTFAWYLNPGAADTGYRVTGPRPEKRPLENAILRALRPADDAPRRRVFVVSYFKHDPATSAEPTLLLVLQNLQREHPHMFLPGDPLRLRPVYGGVPGWGIRKLDQRWNITAVWEIVPVGER